MTMDDMGLYDRQGRRITYEQYCELAGRMDKDGYKRVAETTVGPLWVSTVWLGMDHGFRFRADKAYRPVIFETMVFQAEDESKPPRKPGEREDDSHLHPEVLEWLDQQWRYSTEAEAIEGQQEIVQRISRLLDDTEWVDTFMTQILDEHNRTTTEGTQD